MHDIVFSNKRFVNQLQHLQFHIVDWCNLNCRSCQHFSNIVDKKIGFPNFDSITRDFYRLREIFDDINVIAILGGEPFLNPELGKYCAMIRALFPYSLITIFTNGLLLAPPLRETFVAIRENKISINVTYYPVLVKKIDEICKQLQSENISYSIGTPVENFKKRMSISNQGDFEDTHRNCRDRCCTTLRNGKLYPCYLPATVRFFNDKFSQHIDYDEYIDLYDDEVLKAGGISVVKRLRRCFEICGHCTNKDILLPWQQGKNVEMEDWIV